MKRRPLLLVAAAASFTVAGLTAPPAAPHKPHILGPLAPLAAQAQWLRAHIARDAGQDGRAFALMQSAVELTPQSTGAWINLANQLGLQFASAESGRPAQARADYLAAACSTLREGEPFAREPHLLAMHRGLLLMSHAQTDPDLAWPGGPSQLWLDAASAFDEALGLISEAAHQHEQHEPTQASALEAARDHALEQADL